MLDTYEQVCIRRMLTVVAALFIALLGFAYFDMRLGFVLTLPIIVLPLMLTHMVTKGIVLRISGATLGSILGGLYITIGNWYITTVLFFCTSLIISLYFHDHRKLFFLLMTLIALMATYFMSLTQNVEAGLFFAWHWVLGVTVGSAILFLSYCLFWPKSLRKVQENVLNKLLLKAGVFFENLDQDKSEYLYSLKELHAFMALLNEQENTKLKPWVFALEFLGNFAFSLKKGKKIFLKTPLPPFENALKELSKTLRHYLKTKEQGTLLDLKEKISLLEEEVALLRKESDTWMANPLELRLHVYHTLNELEHLYQALEETCAQKVKKKTTNTIVTQAKISLSQGLLFAVPFLLVNLFLIFTEFPGGLQCLIAYTLAVIQPNQGRVVRQMYLRSLGVLLGGATAVLIMVLLQIATHYFFFLVLFLSAISILGYLSLRYRAWNYAYVQACLALILVFGVESSALPDLSLLIQRFFGVFGGLFLAFVVLFLFPKKDPWRLIAERLGSSLKRIGEIIYATSLGQKESSSQELFSLIEETLEEEKDAFFFWGTADLKHENLRCSIRAVKKMLKDTESIQPLLVNKSFKYAYEIQEIAKEFKELFLSCAEQLKEMGSLHKQDQVENLQKKLQSFIQKKRGELLYEDLSLKEQKALVEWQELLQRLLSKIHEIGFFKREPAQNKKEIAYGLA